MSCEDSHVQTLDGEYLYPASHPRVASFPDKFKPWTCPDDETNVCVHVVYQNFYTAPTPGWTTGKKKIDGYRFQLEFRPDAAPDQRVWISPYWICPLALENTNP